ncbi:MAG: peptidylprolyl isomerase [Anaerolineales bacterium]
MARKLRTRILLVCTLALAGCSMIEAELPTATSTPSPPTATPEPAAATVNGEVILLADFEDEIQRFEAAKREAGIDLATLDAYKNQVLQALIDRRLLAQGARANGIQLETSDVDAAVQDLAVELGGNEAMGVWLAETGYTLEGFKLALEEDMLAARMVENILQDVPENVAQVHARHILLASEEDAQFILEQLAANADFGNLARLYSRDSSTRPDGGDLGWFPRGGLLFPEIETAAFELQPGEISTIVKSDLGYHIVQTLETGERHRVDRRFHQPLPVDQSLPTTHVAAHTGIPNSDADSGQDTSTGLDSDSDRGRHNRIGNDPFAHRSSGDGNSHHHRNSRRGSGISFRPSSGQPGTDRKFHQRNGMRFLGRFRAGI